VIPNGAMAPDGRLLRQWSGESAIAFMGEASVMRITANQAIKEARQIRASITPQLKQMTQDARFRRRFRDSMLTTIVDQAIRITGADMANLQLVDRASKGLRIEAQRGFSQPFLGFFNCVHDGRAVCGTALRNRSQIMVPDVAESPIFLGTPALEVVLDASVRAVQSTPLVGPDGCVLGMISTHWQRPWRPSNHILYLLSLLARGVADWHVQRASVIQ